MTDRLPVHIDPLRLASQGRSFSGQLALESLPRLQGMLASQEGEISAEIAFGHDKRNRPVMQGKLQGQVILTCQRCLQDMEWPVEVDFELVIIDAERAESEADDQSDEVLIVESTPMVLADILEDELILSLPIVPMHDLEHCASAKYVHAETVEEEGEADKPNPFAVLADLKRKDD
jgi:uncharacterized protein